MDIDHKLFTQLKAALPAELFVKNEVRFLAGTFRACALVAVATVLAAKFIPMTLASIPLWFVYAVINGTLATGVWVIGHDCGHGSFSKHKILNDLLGYPLHTVLLVPYFSWQYSHALHHSRTNHIDEGESHVPHKEGTASGAMYAKVRQVIGDDAFSIVNIFVLTTVGWPLYMFTGVTGGPNRGVTNHFLPGKGNKLFPPPMYAKVWASTFGLLGVLAGLGYLSMVYGLWTVVALYGGPYMVVNSWLIMYTYLHHTDIDTPHYDARGWNWTKGALCTIERNYPAIVDWVHFRIGTTHIIHHLFSAMPHYNAGEARAILESKFSSYYRIDNRPFWKALFITIKECAHVKEDPADAGAWVFPKDERKRQ